MIPMRDDVPGRGAPLVVACLILANLVVFLIEISLVAAEGGDAGALAEFTDTWGLVPREFLRGVSQPSATAQIVWLTPIAAMFIHGGLLHLAGNLLYLWIFGPRIEHLLGHGRFLLFYLVCGLAASAVQIASAPDSYAPIVGASGAVSGLLGGYAISYPTSQLRLLWPPLRVPALLFLLVWIVIQILSGLGAGFEASSGIAWWAHVGGFATGMVLVRSMRVRSPIRSRLRI
jgi:membrane associated rhomboid family serine protease